MEPTVHPRFELGSVCQVVSVLAKRHTVGSMDPESAKIKLKFVERPVAGFVLLYAPFCPNGSRLGPFGQNGLIFRGCPGKAPRAERGRGEETSPHQDVLACPTKGSADFLMDSIRIRAENGSQK